MIHSLRCSPRVEPASIALSRGATRDRPRTHQKWCDSIWPQHMWDQAKVEPDIAPTHVTIVEVRPDWMGGPEPTRFPIARLRYTKTTSKWAIYWRDRNLKFHEYQ
jgi:hypothetical protein